MFALNTLVNLFRDKVPYVSTPKWAIDWLCENLPLPSRERLGEGVIYDLGCGDGRVLIALKKKFPTITAIGYERNWWPFILAKIRTKGSDIIIRRKNFYHADLSDARIVFCFLIHSVMPKVEKLLRSQLKPGAIVYSYGFMFPCWKPTAQITNPERPHGSKLNFYRVL